MNHIRRNFSDAVNEMALHFLAKMKIMVVKDIERDDVEFVMKVRRTLMCTCVRAQCLESRLSPVRQHRPLHTGRLRHCRSC
jgi:hypothetical protein